MRPAFFRTRGMEAATGCMHPFLPALRPRPARHAGLRNAWAALAPWRPCFSPGAYPPTQPPPVCTHKNTCCRYNPAPQPLLELVAAIVPRALSSRTAFNQQAISSILFSVATLKARPGEPQGPRQVAPVARGCAGALHQRGRAWAVSRAACTHTHETHTRTNKARRRA